MSRHSRLCFPQVRIKRWFREPAIIFFQLILPLIYVVAAMEITQTGNYSTVTDEPLTLDAESLYQSEIPSRYDYIFSLVNNTDSSIEDYVDEINVEEGLRLDLQDGTNFSSLLLSNQMGTMEFKTV